MPWLYLLVALAALAVAFKTTSVALLMLCLIVAIIAMFAWVMGLLAQRVGSRSRDEAMLIDPVELHRLREQAEARRRAAATDAGAAHAATEPPR
jgi:Flp pilus assembly protein protease CpaA